MNVQKQPSFAAMRNATVRLTPHYSVQDYMTLEIMVPPDYHHETGTLIAEAKHLSMWVRKEDAKALADLIYAQFAMKYVE